MISFPSDLPILPVPVPDPIINYHVPRTISPGDLQPDLEGHCESLIASVVIAEVRRYGKLAPVHFQYGSALRMDQTCVSGTCSFLHEQRNSASRSLLIDA
jgi:hypothetical protein